MVRGQKVCGSIDFLHFPVEVYDERLGVFYCMDAVVDKVDYEGWYEYDPGVRYYADGFGDPPSEDWDLKCVSDFCDLSKEITELLAEMDPGIVLVPDEGGIEDIINDRLSESLDESIYDFLDVDPPEDF